ncbi:MAG: serine/threonine-protein kinase [Rhodothermales bacterium]|nr:serine/threonine-protein kinase [Rhodothermales bacterium]
MIGTTISHYRITDEIGRGGMGVVYKAEDTRLDRTVALKFFPPHALITEDDRARFYREARAAAALHHPNIATVFEIDEVSIPTDSGASKSTPLIAMEYVEGETLTDRIARGPLPLKDVISIATQSAEALKAAHAKDIVHRDVKSGNIMLTSDGKAKVLDFGLAKTAASTKLTQMGSTLGTAAYMSPEQARGEEVDNRSDLWSLGGVIYEMITGRVPFPGDYEQAIVYGILNSDPEPPTALRSGIPMELEWVVDKLLSKDRTKRYQSGDEVIVDLARIDLGAQSTMKTAAYTSAHPAQADAKRSSVPLWTLIAGVVLALLAGALASWFLSTGEREQAVLHLQLAIAEEAGGAVAASNQGPSVALSPDGERLVFRGRSDGRIRLFVQNFAEGGVPTAIDGTENANAPVFSPDGNSIVFKSGNFLKKVGLRGGAPQNVDPRGGEYPSFSWSQDDQIVYVPSYGDGVYRVPASGGDPELLVDPDIEKGEVGFTYPQLLPGGTHILCASYGSGFKIIVIDLEDKTRTVLFEGAIAPRYLPSGHIAFVQKKSLLVAGFDEEGLTIGDPVVMVDGVLSDFDTITSHYAVSASGSLVFLSGSTIWDRDLIEIDRAGGVRVIQTERRGFNGLGLSPDGSLLAAQVLSGLDEAEIRMIDMQSGDAQRFASSPSWENRGPWLPDGSGMVFSSERRGTADIYVQRFGDSGPVSLVTNEHSKYPTSISRDGSLVAYQEVHPETGSDLWLVSMDEPESPRPFLRSSAFEDDAAISPDGRHVAYTSDESGRNEVYVALIEGTSRRVKVSRDGGTNPVWIRSGGGLLYQIDGTVMEVETQDRGRSFSRPRVAFEGVNQWTARADGSAVITLSAVPSPRQPQLVIGWLDEVKRQVPSK